MKMCMIDIFLLGIVILFACLVHKTEGLTSAPISPTNENYRPLKFLEMFRDLRDNSTIRDDYSEMTRNEYSAYEPYQTSHTITHAHEPPHVPYLHSVRGINSVQKHDVFNRPSSGETAITFGSDRDNSQPIPLFRVASG